MPIDRSTLYGQSFLMPDVITDLREEVRSDCAELDADTNAWAWGRLLEYFGSEELAKRYERQRICHFACMVYPRSLPDRKANTHRSMMSIVVLDDTFSRPQIQASAEAAKGLHDRWWRLFDLKAPGPGNPVFSIAWETIELTERQDPLLSAQLRLRWRELADSHYFEAIDRAKKHVRIYEDYIKERLTNIYGWWLTDTIEYQAGICLGDLTSSMPILEARLPAMRHVALVNDLYSFPKEIDHTEEKNAILVWMTHDGYTLQGAVDRLVEEIHLAEAEYVQAREKILFSPLGKRQDVQTYLEGLEFLMTGNLRWSQLTTRYFGDNHDGSSVKAAQIWIEPKEKMYD